MMGKKTAEGERREREERGGGRRGNSTCKYDFKNLKVMRISFCPSSTWDLAAII